MKLSIDMKIAHVMSVVLFILGLYVSNDVVTACATVIFVVLSCTVEILEAIEAKKCPT
jgi:hypothetical protein